jgi:hypothetical protein
MFLHATIRFKVSIAGESTLWHTKINKRKVYLRNLSNVFLKCKKLDLNSFLNEMVLKLTFFPCPS